MAENIRKIIQELWQDTFEGHSDALELGKNFFELGGSSLRGVQLAMKIGEHLNIFCPPTTVLEHSTLSALSNFVVHLHQFGNASSNDNFNDIVIPTASIGLTKLQQAYWFGEQQHYEMGGAATWFSVYLAEEVDISRLQIALDKLVERHSMLRSFIDKDANISINPAQKIQIQYECIDTQDEATQNKTIVDSIKNIEAELGALNEGPHLAIKIMKSYQQYHILMAGRLIIMDGRSAEVFAGDLWHLYHGNTLEPLSLSALDYLKIHEEKRTQFYAQSKEYWLERINSLPGAPEIPKRRKLASQQHIAPMQRLNKTLSREQWGQFKKNAALKGITPTIAICTAFSEILSLWSGSEHFTINMMYGNRQAHHRDANAILGCLSDTLLLEIDLQASSFADHAKAVQKQMFSDMSHAHISGVDVLRELARAKGYASNQPLMPIVFASGLGLDSSPEGGESGFFMEKFGWSSLASGIQTPHVLLDHQIAESNGALLIQWDVRKELLPTDMPESMFQAYLQLIERLTQKDTLAWDQLPLDLLPAADRQARALANQTEVSIDNYPLLHEAFFNTACRLNEKLALCTKEEAWSYSELLGWSQQIAQELTEKGVRPGELIGVLLPKSPAQIAATLGILFAGGVYVPLSVDMPHQRVEQIVQQSNIRFILASSEKATNREITAELIQAPEYSPEVAINLTQHFTQQPSDLAYVIFTSGTTGTPKGVAITHESAMNTLIDINHRFDVTQNDSVLGVSELNFDLSVYDIFGVFLTGACLVLPAQAFSKNPIHLVELVKKFNISVWNSVPAFLEMIVEYCEIRSPDGLQSLRRIFMSGDWIPITFPDRIKKINPNCKIISMGGATEASIWSNYHEITDIPSEWTSIPYGKPLANQYFSVLDSKFRDAPTWVAGELYIGGKGLAREYHGDETKTAEQFITHPRTSERLYRTGDWGRYWPDGTLEFLGRKDTQVKIRGHRIELGDIEAAFARIKEVKDAAVVVRQAADKTQTLFAFVTLNSQITAEQLVQKITEMLPAYMVPAKINTINEFPLTVNAKIDRKALINSIVPDVKTEVSGGVPTSRSELQIESIWRDILGINSIALGDNFFALGGNSITAIRMMNRLSNHINRDLPLTLIFEHPTLQSLAKSLDEQCELDWTPLVPLKIGTDQPAIFCVHPVGGNVFCYRELAGIWSGDVWGLQSRGTYDGQDPHNSIREMAIAYSDAITLKQPQGTINLLGWSMGGLISLEIARLLKRQGRAVKVALLDTWVPKSSIKSHAFEQHILLKDFFFDLSSGVETCDLISANTSFENAIQYGSEALSKHGWSLEADQHTLINLFKVYATNHNAIAEHFPYSVDVPVILFDAVRRQSGCLNYLNPLVAESMWVEALPNLRRIDLETNHFSIINAAELNTIISPLTDFFKS